MKRPELLHCTACFSGCLRYRYSLSREWDTRKEQVCWIMLNPSKATADVADPTIRRCIDFSFRFGYGGLVVVNLFAMIATFPNELHSAKDPVGPHNDEAILQAIRGRRVICAWGNQFCFPRFVDRVTAVMTLLQQTRTPAFCLGQTRFGHPSHPVRLARKRRPRRFDPPASAKLGSGG